MNNFSSRSPKDYYYNNDRRWDLSDLENTDDDDDSENGSENDTLVDYRLRKKQNFIILSSLDRNWTDKNNKETPYNFTIQINSANNFNNLKLNNSLKNIIGLSVIKMMLHNKNVNVEYTNNNTKFTDYNYLVVDVNGFNNINTGTNDVLTSASAVMVSLTPIPTVMSMRTLEFKNVNSSLITYPINPISSLNKFEVKIKNNLGFSPNSNIEMC